MLINLFTKETELFSIQVYNLCFFSCEFLLISCVNLATVLVSLFLSYQSPSMYKSSYYVAGDHLP